jgi:hypothetical protein
MMHKYRPKMQVTVEKIYFATILRDCLKYLPKNYYAKKNSGPEIAKLNVLFKIKKNKEKKAIEFTVIDISDEFPTILWNSFTINILNHNFPSLVNFAQIYR